MLNSSKIERAFDKLSEEAELCQRGKQVSAAWINATITGNVADYNIARYHLVSALKDHVKRFIIVAPLMSWKTENINILVLSPYYKDYDDVKQICSIKKNWLPFHLPVELEAGLGSFATGNHLILFLDKLIPCGKSILKNDRLSFEFLNSWRARWDVATNWLTPVVEPSIKNYMQNIAFNDHRQLRVILGSILTHEMGHIDGLWPIFPEHPNFEISAFANISPCQKKVFRVICSALGDISADVAYTNVATNDFFIPSVVNHLLNFRYCWQLESFNY